MVDCLPIPRCEYEQDIPACLGLTTVLDEITDDNYTGKISPGLQIIKDDGYCLTGPITSAKGFGGNVVVTLTIENNAILSASAVGEKETVGIGSRAIETMPAEILSFS